MWGDSRASIFDAFVAASPVSVMMLERVFAPERLDAIFATHTKVLYLADEIQGTYRGMMVAIPAEHWQTWGQISSITRALRISRISIRYRTYALTDID